MIQNMIQVVLHEMQWNKQTKIFSSILYSQIIIPQSFFTNTERCCIEFWAGSEWFIGFWSEYWKKSQTFFQRASVRKQMKVNQIILIWDYRSVWTKNIMKCLQQKRVVECFCQLILISSHYKMFQSCSLGILYDWLPETHSIFSSFWIEAFSFFKNRRTVNTTVRYCICSFLHVENYAVFKDRDNFRNYFVGAPIFYINNSRKQ